MASQPAKRRSPVALALLITGLLMTTLSLTVGRNWPDANRGIAAGLGLGLELLALLLLLRQMRSRGTA